MEVQTFNPGQLACLLPFLSKISFLKGETGLGDQYPRRPSGRVEDLAKASLLGLSTVKSFEGELRETTAANLAAIRAAYERAGVLFENDGKYVGVKFKVRPREISAVAGSANLPFAAQTPLVPLPSRSG